MRFGRSYSIWERKIAVNSEGANSCYGTAGAATSAASVNGDSLEGSKKRVVVIKNGMVGQRFMENLIDLNKDKRCIISWHSVQDNSRRKREDPGLWRCSVCHRIVPICTSHFWDAAPCRLCLLGERSLVSLPPHYFSTICIQYITLTLHELTPVPASNGRQLKISRTCHDTCQE